MKILHTADWHLGKRLEKFSRFEEQQIKASKPPNGSYCLPINYCRGIMITKITESQIEEFINTELCVNLTELKSDR